MRKDRADSRRLAMEYGFRLIYRKPFNEILADEQSSRDFGPLLGRMGVVNDRGESAMDADQWEAASTSFLFSSRPLCCVRSS